jgi:hypothetical protein
MKLKLALSLVVLLLLLGCISYTPTEEQPKNETVTPPVVLQCREMKDLNEGDRCYYNEAISKNNLTACSSILSNSLRDSCNLKFAISLNDSSLCARILNNNSRDDCYYTLAPTAGLTVCNKIENATMRKNCRLELGDDTVLCENLTEDYDFHLCMAKARNNYSICADITNSSFVNQCYVSFAKSKDNYSLCSLLADSGTHDECFRYFANLHSNYSLCNKISSNYTKYLCLTKLTGNYSLCNELSDYLQRDSCVGVFASEHVNYSLCLNISTNLYRDRCYTDIAVKTLNADICSYIRCYECIADKNDCYYQLANLTGNISLCGNINEQSKSDTCRLDLAKSHRSPAFCSYVENSYQRNTCYYSIIYNEKLEPSACAPIVHQNWRDECYNKVAIDKKNATICEKIEDPFTKNKCVYDSS